MTAVHFSTCPASPRLAGAVRELWLLDDPGAFIAGLPKPHVELVVSLSGIHWWRSAPAAREHRYAQAWVTPIQHGPRYARAVGRRRLIGARLEPWAAMALFGPLPPGDGTPPPRLDRLIGSEARRLRASLIDAPDDRERFVRFTAWLEARIAPRRTAVADPAQEDIGASATVLARAMGVTPRTLRRRFAAEVGVSPKAWLKLRRLDAVLRDPGLGDDRQSLADMAYAHGYADQAHFSREIAGLTGSTPSGLRRRAARLPPHFLPRS